MLDAINISPRDAATPSALQRDVPRDGLRRTATGGLRTLTTNDVLFQKGDTRSGLYRVEHGALCHYIQWDDGRHEVIEFAFPGDIVGLGFVEAHVSTAQAVVETEISHVAPAEFERELAADGLLAARLAAAADREFEALRGRALAAGRDTPVKRLASLLAALAAINGSEGRDGSLIGDDLTAGLIAGQLDLNVAELTHALVELKSKGLVTSAAGGLRLTNIPELEKLASAA